MNSYVLRLDDAIAGVFSSMKKAEVARQYLLNERGYSKFIGTDDDYLVPYIYKVETNQLYKV